MKLLFILIVLIVLICEVFSLKSSDVCKMDKDCDGNKCEENICEYPEFNHQCGKDYCARNKDKCQLFLKICYVARMNNLRSIDSQIKKYLTFRNKINSCELEPELKSFDVCLNGVDCLKQKRLPNLTYIIKQVDCPCRGKYSYQCGKKFCSTQKIDCEKFLVSKRLSVKNFTEKRLKTCGNGGFVMKENLNIFRMRY